MLNLKKGLALVLAAATAFTFAPVSSFAAVTWNDDGLTKSDKIDSIDFTNFKLSSTAGTDASKTIHVTEHNDKSNNGTDVKAFRVEISRAQDKDDERTFYDLVKLDSSTSYTKDPVTNTNFDSATNTGSAATVDETWGDPDAKTYLKSVNYIVPYTASKNGTDTATDASNEKYKKLGGALLTFTANTAHLTQYFKHTNARSVTVKISSLDANSADATVLDTSTFTIDLITENVKFEIQAPEKIQPEDKDVYVPWKVSDNGKGGNTVSKVYVTADPSDQITENAYPSAENGYSIADGQNANGELHFKTYIQGDVTVTVHAWGTKADGNTGDIATQSFTLNVTPSNGKLRVSYTTDSTLPGYKGQRYTFTDDAETRSQSNMGIERCESTVNTVNANGEYTVNATPIKGADGKSFATVEGSTNYITSNGKNIDATNYSSANTNDQKKVVYKLDNKGVLPAAEPVVENGQKTLQITASSDSNAKISYTLVAPVSRTDKTVWQTANTSVSKTYYYNPITGKFSGDFDGYEADAATTNTSTTANGITTWTNALVKHDSPVTAGDSELYTAAEGKKYGAVDSNGLVTLKNANFDVPLYVVISAKQADKTATAAQRKTSTFIVPIKTAQLTPLTFYASSENGAEVDETGIISSETQNADGKIYLSDAHTSDKLTVDTNAGDAYISGDVNSTDGKFSYDEATNTVSVDTTKAKDGDSATLTIKTSSAPDIAGTITAKFTVEYHKDWKNTNSLELSDATVSKTSPRDKVEAKTSEAASTVVFDTQHFYKKANNKRGYELVKSTDAGYYDVITTSTGWVTYQKNDGEVYVRAQAKKDGFIPTKWVYAKVTYGQNATPNDLAVTEDRVVIKAGEKAEVHATASTAISFTVDDTAVATVASAGAIQVTGVKPGQTTLNVTAAADTKKGIAEKTIKVPVVVTDANGEIPSNDNVKKPAKVTGVKITNLKGGKVKVTWTKQSQKNIKYYVKKTVGKKSSGKSVGSNKATLSVKKGATVKVKVKAYIYDATGKKLVGSYSKTVTKKTDKK